MSRNAAQRGQPIALTATFLDAGGEVEDPSNITVAVYPPGFDPRNIGVTLDDAWVHGVTLSDPGAGPYVNINQTITKLSEGKYQYIFTPPADATLGAAFDRWQGTVDLVALDETFSFTIVGGGSIGTTQLYDNNAVFITLSHTIADTDGNTLGTDYEMYFTTTYDPHYTSVRRVRLDLGALVADIPDDTINLAIFEASLEAQALSFGLQTFKTNSVATFFNFARRQYVTCVAEMILLGAISGSSSVEGGGKSKRLADLQVNFGGGGQFKSLLDRAIGCKLKWEATLTSAGEIGPGTSQKPSMVIKGRYDPDRPEFGREWEPVSTHSGIGSEYPAANVKSRNSVLYRRWRGNFMANRWGSRFVTGD
ncbi:MAG: hypothetical protein ACXABY_29465 [Candidatus Thorarchaeota archaeon]|jgi:hypothetical protein